MIPNNQITEEFVESDWLYDNVEEDLVYQHIGGKDIQDVSESLTYQMWEMTYEANIIKLRSLTNNRRIDVKTVTEVSELSFAFTLNMLLTYIYKKLDKCYLNYYDTVLQQYREISFDNMNTPKLIYDDLRTTQTNSSDVILFYVNSLTNKLCCRLLRDRYTIEYELQEVSKHTKLLRVGMTDKLRLKFKLQGFN